MRYSRAAARLAALLSLGSLTVLSGSPAGALYSHDTSWGTTGAALGDFSDPIGIAVDGLGAVYVSDSVNHRVQRFSTAGGPAVSFGSFGIAPGQLWFPQAVAVDNLGNVFVAEANNDRVSKFSTYGTFISSFGSNGTDDGEFDGPAGVAVDGSGNVYVTDYANSRVQKFTTAGDFVKTWGAAGNGDGEFSQPSGIETDAAGNVYVADAGNDRIQKFTADGELLAIFGATGSGDDQLDVPTDVAIDGSGNLFIADALNHRVQMFSAAGSPIGRWGSVGSGAAQLNLPSAIALDQAGNVLVTERGNNRVSRFRPVLPETTASGPAGLIKDPTPTFTLTSTINPATFECRVKGSGIGFAPCTSPYTAPELDDGPNVILVRAIDAHRLTDATPYDAEIRVDATLPATFIDSGPTATTRDRTPTFVFESNERGTFQCSLDGGAFTACTSPRTTAQLSYGKHTFRVRARDRAGNFDATPATRTFTVVR